VRVEERVLEEQVGGVIKQLGRVGALLGERAVGIESLANGGWRFSAGDRAIGKGIEKSGDAVDELRAEGSELL
jgi:hypothetical protein